MSKAWRSRLTQIVAVLALVASLLGLRMADIGLVSTLRGAGFDSLQRLYPRNADATLPVRVVDIDEASLLKLGQWPWSRLTIARLVEQLSSLGAAAIVFDIVFPEPDRLSPRRIMQDEAVSAALPDSFNFANLTDSDQALAAAIQGKPVVLAFALAPPGTSVGTLTVKSGFAQIGAPAHTAAPQLQGVISNLPMLDAVAAGIGGINLDLAGEQGVARQIPLLRSDGARYAPSLALEALRVAQGADTIVVTSDNDTEGALISVRVGDIEIPISEAGQFHVHYRPDAKDLSVSAAAVLDAVNNPELKPLLEGHVVFIGTSAVGLSDLRTNALGEIIPGVTIHAQAVEQMLQGRFLSRPEWVEMLELAWVALGGLAIAIAGAMFRPWPNMVLTSVLSLVVVAAAVYGFRAPGLLLDATYPLAALVLTYLASTAFRLAVTDRDGRNMRKLFGHYVAPSVLADIERNPDTLKLGGEVRDVTVMFVDIANFTPLSEKLTPEELVNVVNGLWNACSHEILAQKGTIDKYIGDAIMAFWNAPVLVPDHQWHAAKAALGIRHAVAKYNSAGTMKALIEKRAIPEITVRIGLASGPACVGNMGSSERFDYSVLGETVNTAARTEASCKNAGHDILIAGTLAPATQKLAILKAGHMAMKGKSALEPIHAVVGDETEKAGHAFDELLKEHNHIISKLADPLPKKALATLRQLLDEMALQHPNCAVYLRRLADRPEDFRSTGNP